jgi:phosphotransferase system HPr (HPr) family protein
VERTDFTVTDPIGLHARPAAEVVKTAARHQARVRLELGGKTADARSIVQLLGLGVRQGSVVTVTAEGADEAEALAAVLAVLQRGAAA